MAKKLTVTKRTYGVSNRPVVMLDYHNGGEAPTYEILQGAVDINVLERIQIALDNGFEIEVKGFKREQDR